MTSPVGLISVFAAVALATSSAAVGQSPSTTGTNYAENKVVCKKQARTGTRFADKICKTNAQWEELRNQQLRDAREMIDRPQIETRRGG